MIAILKNVLFGFVIGIAAIIPGLSGGVLAVSLGIYPKIISSISEIRTNFKESIMFLLPYIFGAAIGALVFGNVMKPLLENCERSVIWLFMGLIIGSVPSLLKEATEKGFKISYFVPMVIAYAAGVFFSTSAEVVSVSSPSSAVLLLVGGGIFALGAIVPGLSSSFMLMQLGVYDRIISSFVEFNIPDILWIALGAILVFFATVKLIHLAFEKFHGFSCFAALGFLLSCVIAVYPGMGHITDGFLLLVGVVIVRLFEKFTVN